MKRIFMAIAAMTMLIATSCKDSVNAPEDLVPGDGEFLVTIAGAPRQEAPTNGKTVKTIINGNDIIWQNLDSISINGVVYETNTTGSSAIFRLPASTAQPAQIDEDGKYKAYYPVEIAPTAEAAGELHATIRYNGGNLKNLPMYAESENNVLTFHNICAALRIAVPENCDQIVISATENLAGKFSIGTNEDTDAPMAVLSTADADAESMSNTITVNGTFTAGDSVYVALPAGTYTNFAVKFLYNGTPVMYRELERLTVKVNNLYNLTFRAIPADAFCFIANGACTLKFSNHSLLNYYTTVTPVEDDPYNDWVLFPSVGLALNDGDKVYIKAKLPQQSLGDGHFSSEGEGTLTVSGNIMYLLDPTGCQKDFTESNEYAFLWLFRNMSKLEDASDLILPAKTLASSCYYSMFNGCTSLTAAPALPAETLASDCYNGMFEGCTKLAAAPALPAETLATYCYNYMFSGCTSLEAAPALPAETLASHCYRYMFFNCTKLAAAPALPAETLASNCYECMFQGCTSLTAAPALHAETLASLCYNYMFYGCTSLGVSTTEIQGAKTLEVPSDADSYTNWGQCMFNGCVQTGFSGDPLPNRTYYFYDATPQPQN